MTNLALLVMVEVVLVLGKPNSTPRKFISLQTGMIEGFGHIRVIKWHPPWRNILVGVIRLMLLEFLYLVLLLEIV